MLVLVANVISVSYIGSSQDTSSEVHTVIKDNVGSDVSNSSQVTLSQTDDSDSSEKSAQKINYKKNMKGIWIPCMSLQLSAEEQTESGFRHKIETIIKKCTEQKINTVIVQVRPFGDAIYPSEYYPWSHILTGTQGKALDFDPLEYIIDCAHKNKLSFHAWINPLRISTGSIPDKLSENNPYIIWKNDSDKENDLFTFRCGDGIYYDPSFPEVRKLIIDGVKELARKYDIDGIQIDDYFYPSDEADLDKQSYSMYLKSISDNCTPLSLSDWRKNNINMLISGIYSSLHSQNENLVFGIAPQGNFDNNEKMCADVKSWSTYKGFADYICPQLYVSNEHPIFPFKELADEWRKYISCDDTKLYYGLALYKVGTDSDEGTWLNDSSIIQNQIEYAEKSGADGYILYSYEYIDML